MKKIFYCLVAALVLAACVKEDASIAKVEEVKNPYAVTPDEAVQLLKSVMGGESTRAISVGEIKTLRKSDFVPTTRGGEDGDVIYIVDLENGGSAVMGADKRMEPIYAILDETKISAEKLTLTATRTDDGEQDIEEYVLGLMNNKIQADARAISLPEMPIVPRPQRYTQTINILTKAPLLRTKWQSAAPYSNAFPSGIGLHCGPIALSQLYYYNRFPANIGNRYFNWTLISEYEIDGNKSAFAAAEVADFVYSVAMSMEGPGENDKMTKIGGVLYSMNNAGYLSVQNKDYNTSDIRIMLSRNTPCIVYGDDPNYPIEIGHHAWLIDGCNFFDYNTYEREFDGLNPNIYTDTLISSVQTRLVHCNYGWGGEADGYYNSEVFNLSEIREDEYIDTSVGDKQMSVGVYYSNNLGLIYYEK